MRKNLRRFFTTGSELLTTGSHGTAPVGHGNKRERNFLNRTRREVSAHAMFSVANEDRPLAGYDRTPGLCGRCEQDRELILCFRAMNRT